MPAALNIAVAFLISIGASGTIAFIGAYVLAGVLVVGFAMGVNALTQALFGPSRPKPSDGLIETRQPVGSRRRNIGIVHSAGQLTFEESRGGTLGLVLTLGTGREGDIIEHRINDNPVTLSASGTVTESRYKGAIAIHTRSGTDTQTAIGQMTAKFPEWTANHRQLGCAHAAILCAPVDAEDFSEVYNGRKPSYTQIRKGVGQYDPRQDSTAVIGIDGQGQPVYGNGACRIDDEDSWPWSDNWAVCTANYFAHRDGFGGGYDMVNWANIAVEADISDQTENTKSGETIKRWRLWASYSLAEEKRAQILTDMITAADGFCWQDAQGLFNLSSGRWEEPDLVLRDSAIMRLSAVQGPDAEQRIGAMKVLYTDPTIGYREQESATIGRVEDTGSGEVQALQAYYAPHHNQAMRVGKPAFARLGNERWSIEVTCNLLGLDLLGRRFCKLDSAIFGVTGWFEIERPRIDFGTMTVSAKLTEVTPEDWTFDAAVDEGTPPGSQASASGPVTMPVPQNVVLSGIPIAFGATNGVAIQADWDDPGRRGLEFEAQYREAPGGEWMHMAVTRDVYRAQSGPVNSGTQYQVRVRSLGLLGRTSDWSVTASITPIANNSIAPPSGLSASAGNDGEATLIWRNPTGASFDHVKLFEGTTDDIVTAAQLGDDFPGGLGAVMEHTATGLAAGTRYFWARSYDAQGNASSATGPVTASIT